MGDTNRSCEDEAEPRNHAFFPIVGIGASAGGLEALEEFFRHAPADAGIAFVVVQHLDPDHKGAMVELLQRTTPMRVTQVEDGQDVEPDRVYVIPPGMDVSILHGRLYLMPLSQPRGLNLPIDGFFRSLAADREQRSIGVVLSGMGSDGTLGLRAIKEKAGSVFVQSLASARFTGMPASAIEAGLADVVAPAEELPDQIVAFLRHASHFSPQKEGVAESDRGAIEKTLLILRAQTGNDFSLYKRSTVQRRIERRMGLHQIAGFSNYVRYLRENPREVELLFKELLIGVTSFFRDSDVWEQLRATLAAELLPAREKAGVVRAWVPACSTGEEAYSLAMVLRQAIEQFESAGNITFQIYATDVDQEAVNHARLGLYPSNIAADVPAEYLSRFFVAEEDRYRVRKEIRETVVFAPQNVTADPPFTRIDVLSCRNLLIYLSPELQNRVIRIFHYALNPGGFLFLGSAETVGSPSGLFGDVGSKGRLYRRLEGSPRQAPEIPRSVAAPVEREPPRERVAASPASLSLEAVATRLIVERFSPPAVLTTETGDILYVSARTGQYLEPAVGKANLNIFAMAREGLRAGLSQAFDAALAQDSPVAVRRVKVRTNGAVHTVDLTVQRLREPKELRGTVMTVIVEAPPQRGTRPAPTGGPSEADQQLAALERELQRARAESQTIREEMRSSQEELTSTNEELQSANEELTTSKEEMQSMNEELQTVNFELQSKVNALSRANNDVGVLLNGTDIATLFLDNELRIRRFTPKATSIIRLIPSDIGRPIADITGDLHYPELSDDAREVLRTLVVSERQVPTRDGRRWFAARVMPYRTVENAIDGVVITLMDISASAMLLETTLREQASQLRQMAESLPSLVWGFRPDGACDYLSLQWREYTGVSPADHLGFGWLEQVHDADRERVRQQWGAAVLSGTALNTEFRVRSRDGAFRWFRTRSAPIRDEGGRIVKWYATSTDVDDLKEAALARERVAERLTAILAGVGEPFLALDDDLVITEVNPAAERVLERQRDDLVGKHFSRAFPEAAASALERELGQGVRDRVTRTFRAELEHAGRARPYDVRLHPHATGLALFLRPCDGGDR
jgi:two-component system, chemotaxis family, CheB/CheR fusion protein